MWRLLIVAVAAAVIGAGANAQSYLIQPGDRLEISVLEDPGLGRTVLVRPDGRISLPLAGSVEVAGRTPEAVESLIRQRLARDFVAPPTVTVALAGLGSPEAADGPVATVSVMGQVGSPGRYDIALPLDVLQLLAQAGGPSVFAATRRIQVRRRIDGAEAVFLFDYNVIESGAVNTDRVARRRRDRRPATRPVRVAST